MMFFLYLSNKAIIIYLLVGALVVDVTARAISMVTLATG